MKAHIGVDAHSGLVHTVIGTAGNVSDVTLAKALLHGAEEAAFGDAGYQGIENREESQAATVVWHVAMKPSSANCWTAPNRPTGRAAQLRQGGFEPESPFPCREKYLQAPQGPLQRPGQKHAQLFSLFALSNLVLAHRLLLGDDSQIVLTVRNSLKIGQFRPAPMKANNFSPKFPPIKALNCINQCLPTLFPETGRLSCPPVRAAA